MGTEMYLGKISFNKITSTSTACQCIFASTFTAKQRRVSGMINSHKPFQICIPQSAVETIYVKDLKILISRHFKPYGRRFVMNFIFYHRSTITAHKSLARYNYYLVKYL